MTTVSKRLAARFAALAVLTLLLPLGARGLERVGPTAPTHGFPVWYQDDTGITLDLCVPANTAQAAYCALPETPPAGFPESFPTNWVGEHFYWVGEAIADNATTDALLVLALESTFAAEDPIPGDQTVFGRMRIRVGRGTAIPNGLYRVYTPYGVRDFNVTAGEINQTWDIGIACAPGQFDCALQSDIDRFLIPADEPGGNELAPVTFEGRQYLADPGIPTFVTGSRAGDANGEYTLSDGVTTRNANVFLVERVSPGRAIVAETYEFSISGRLFNGTVEADVHVDRTSYANDGNGNQVDVFATGFPARPRRVPTDPIVAEPPYPQIAFFSLPCGGPEEGPHTAPAGTAVPLARDGNTYWARELDVTLPRAICVEKILPGEPEIYELVDPLPDQITVTRAQYLPETRTLVVEASSSDVFDSQLSLGQFGSMTENLVLDTGFVNLVLPEPGAPPATIRVISNQGGVGIAEVATRLPAAPIPAASLEVTASLSSPQPPNTAVTFTAQCQGTPFPCEYQFWVNDGTDWSIAQAYSPDATYVLNRPAGNYMVAVWTRTSTAVAADVYGENIPFVFQAAVTPATSVSVTANPTSPSTEGASVTFTATGSGSTTDGAPTPAGTYQYRFFLDDGSGWQQVADYGEGNSYTLVNPAAGTYQVAVWVRTKSTVTADVYGPAVPHVVTGEVATPATGATLDAAPASPSTAGTDVVFTATGTGSTTGGEATPQAGYSFRFWINDGSGWTMAQDWGTGSYTLTGPAAGNYEVAVWVSTNGGTTVDYYGPGVPHVVEEAAPQ